MGDSVSKSIFIAVTKTQKILLPEYFYEHDNVSGGKRRPTAPDRNMAAIMVLCCPYGRPLAIPEEWKIRGQLTAETRKSL